MEPCLHSSFTTLVPAVQCRCSHLLDGITASASSLPPFLPVSDPRLPDARQGKVLSLHHLEGRNYTYKDTQLLRYNNLNRSSPVSKIPFRANGSHTQIPPDSASHQGKRRDFSIFVSMQRTVRVKNAGSGE